MNWMKVASDGVWMEILCIWVGHMYRIYDRTRSHDRQNALFGSYLEMRRCPHNSLAVIPAVLQAFSQHHQNQMREIRLLNTKEKLQGESRFFPFTTHQ